MNFLDERTNELRIIGHVPPRLQQAWLVVDTPRQVYTSCFKRGPDDKNIGWCERKEDSGYNWLPMRKEWRDVELVNDTHIL